MATFGSRFRPLFLAALAIATTFACDDQQERGTDNNKIDCPLGQNCDGGAGNGGVLTQNAGGTEYTATGGTTAVIGGEGGSIDSADIELDATTDSTTAAVAGDSGIVESVDAAIDTGIAEADTIDALSVGDEYLVETDSTIDTTESGDSGEPCEGGHVNGNEAKSLVAKGALLLDVRTPFEFATDAIAGAINIPLDELANRLDELPTDRTIITYCSSGNRSGQAAQLLLDQGFIVCDLGPRSAWDG